MNFQEHLESVIRAECDKLALRYHAYHNGLHLEHVRHLKRVSNAPPKQVRTPTYWDVDPKFNPFYVRRKSKSIARSIARTIADGTYAPHKPHLTKILKPNGSHREIEVYQIPDAAVSKAFYFRLLEKNKHRFSAFSYAYRSDRNVHFAIQDIAIDIARDARSFIAEFDFSDFFGSISHAYLGGQFDQNGFLISEEERRIIWAFLKGRERGIPQGTSISLFLANLACWRLDHGLEREGVKFARYADDTIVWSLDYQKICSAFSIISEFSSAAGIPINAEKSAGISLLSKEGLPSELSSRKTHVEFLGYSISVGAVSIKRASVKKIKRQISYLLYRNLIQPLRGKVLRGLVIPSNNRDDALLVAISQVRRYMYGGLTSAMLRRYINGRSRRISFKGIMSFYPLVNDEAQLRALDGWLTAVLYRAVQLRSRLLKKWKFDRSDSFPFNVPHGELVKSFRAQIVAGKQLLEIPSFMLIYRALQIGLMNQGIERIMNPESIDYDY